jgi:hypothetical protein
MDETSSAPASSAELNTLGQIGAAALFFMQCCLYLRQNPGGAPAQLTAPRADDGRLMTLLVGCFFDLLADAWGRQEGRPPATAEVERISGAVRVRVQVAAPVPLTSAGSRMLRAMASRWQVTPAAGGTALEFEVSGPSLAAGARWIEPHPPPAGPPN